ncbi:MAG: NUDIX domain-containing protein [Defluviitaleaceae bacterium]|nr:NUDIX domain-containing protein [Defluviitaleaceae bacterium]
MFTRITAGAFLTCGERILLLKRGLHKKLGPGMWAGIGGHMDAGDIRDPRTLDLRETCLREVAEEAGVAAEEIRNLTLRYLAIRKTENELRLTYHFFGELETEIPPPECDEGELFWTDTKKIPDLPMSTSVKEALLHWMKNPGLKNSAAGKVFFVAVNPDGAGAVVSEI